MSNAFTPLRSWRSAGPGNQDGQPLITIEGTLVIDTTANGGAVDGDLPSTIFGISSLVGSQGCAVSDANTKVFPISPSYDGDSIMVGGGTAGAVMDLPDDTYKITVTGYQV